MILSFLITNSKPHSYVCTDFEDMSCDMVYGQPPPPFEEDPVAKQPCFADVCKFSRRRLK